MQNTEGTEDQRFKKAKTFAVLAAIWAVISILPILVLVRGLETEFTAVHLVCGGVAFPLPILILLAIIFGVMKK